MLYRKNFILCTYSPQKYIIKAGFLVHLENNIIEENTSMQLPDKALGKKGENVKKTWWKEAVVYQIYTRSFKDTSGDGVGDLNGVTEKLDYLQSLGVDILWLCPMYKSPNVDNGYDVSDYRDIMDEMGTMDDFDNMLKNIHSRGMKLILDLVLNHTSDQHPWFLESKSSKDNPKRDWYIWRDRPTNWESIFGEAH